MAEAVGRWHVALKSRALYRHSVCWIGCGSGGTGPGFSPRTSVFHLQYHSTNASCFINVTEAV